MESTDIFSWLRMADCSHPWNLRDVWIYPTLPYGSEDQTHDHIDLRWNENLTSCTANRHAFHALLVSRNWFHNSSTIYFIHKKRQFIKNGWNSWILHLVQNILMINIKVKSHYLDQSHYMKTGFTFHVKQPDDSHEMWTTIHVNHLFPNSKLWFSWCCRWLFKSIIILCYVLLCRLVICFLLMNDLIEGCLHVKCMYVEK